MANYSSITSLGDLGLSAPEVRNQAVQKAPRSIDEIIFDASNTFGVDRHLISGLIGRESAGDPNAESYKGAGGLMQIMPATAREIAGELGEEYTDAKRWDPETNIRWGTYYIKKGLDKYMGDTKLALAHYHGGPSVVLPDGSINPEATDGIMFTTDYADDVMRRADVNRVAGMSDIGSLADLGMSLKDLGIDKEQLLGMQAPQDPNIVPVVEDTKAPLEMASQNVPHPLDQTAPEPILGPVTADAQLEPIPEEKGPGILDKGMDAVSSFANTLDATVAEIAAVTKYPLELAGGLLEMAYKAPIAYAAAKSVVKGYEDTPEGKAVIDKTVNDATAHIAARVQRAEDNSQIMTFVRENEEQIKDILLLALMARGGLKSLGETFKGLRGVTMGDVKMAPKLALDLPKDLARQFGRIPKEVYQDVTQYARMASQLPKDLVKSVPTAMHNALYRTWKAAATPAEKNLIKQYFRWLDQNAAYPGRYKEPVLPPHLKTLVQDKAGVPMFDSYRAIRRGEQVVPRQEMRFGLGNIFKGKPPVVTPQAAPAPAAAQGVPAGIQAPKAADQSLANIAAKQPMRGTPMPSAAPAGQIAPPTPTPVSTPDTEAISESVPVDDQSIVNAIDRTLTQPEKVEALAALTAENSAIVDPLLASIDKALGSVSKSSYKKPENILAKANRPEIKSQKPWFDVEHVRDSFRFKTVVNSFEDIPSAVNMILDGVPGAEVIKLDTEKMMNPKELGWRFAAIDMRMPNGQLVEYYFPLTEMEAIKKTQNHGIFEKWRNKTEEERLLGIDEYTRDIMTSTNSYNAAFDSALARLGLDATTAEASWNKASASLERLLESPTREKLSLRSSIEGAPADQDSPALMTENLPGAETQTLPSPALETKKDVSITDPPSSTNIHKKQPESIPQDVVHKTESKLDIGDSAEFIIEKNPKIPEKAALLTAGHVHKAIETGEYSTILHPDNKTARALFEKLTGKKLPKGVKATRDFFSGSQFKIVEETKPEGKPASTSVVETAKSLILSTIEKRMRGRDQKNWDQLGSLQVEQVKDTFKQIKGMFGDGDVKARIEASRATRFDELVEAVNLIKEPTRETFDVQGTKASRPIADAAGKVAEATKPEDKLTHIHSLRNRAASLRKKQDGKLSEADEAALAEADRVETELKGQGYETNDLLGQDYSEGMSVDATFKDDPTLPEGVEKITKIITPRVDKDGVLVQVPKVEVSMGPEAAPQEPTRETFTVQGEKQEVDVAPTDPQKEAGNYKMAHITKGGLDISIENPKGSVRSGTDDGGREWSQELRNDYGYIRGTVGYDKDHLDVFLAPNIPPMTGDMRPVYVINQVNPKTGEFDEHKIMVGFTKPASAKRQYLMNYEKGWNGFGSIVEMTHEAFREWAFSDAPKAGELKKTSPGADLKGEKDKVDTKPQESTILEKKGKAEDVLEQPDKTELEGKPAEDVLGDGGKRDVGGVGDQDGGGRGAQVRAASEREPDAAPRSEGAGDVRATPADSGGRHQSRGDATTIQSPGTLRGRTDDRNDYHIADSDAIGVGSPQTKYKTNVEAIRLLKDLEKAGRLATPEEQSVLVKYVGWGMAPQAFDDKNAKWTDQYKELKDLLTPSEYAAAKASTINAHYTSPDVVKAMWSAVSKMGFAGGPVLEPAMGTGMFYGLRPSNMKMSMHGVELDELTGKIARQLYQSAAIEIQGYQDYRQPANHFNLAISNVPFSGKIKPYEPSEVRTPGIPAGKHVLHDFFFLKALHGLRPGGVEAFITSRYTLDKTKTEIREAIAATSDLVGAIRLPNTAFKGIANTEVVTDIIFLQKREPGTAPSDLTKSFIRSAPMKAGEKTYNVNKYYHDNPDMVIGEHSSQGSMYSDSEYTVTIADPKEMKSRLDAAINNLPKDIIGKQVDKRTTKIQKEAQSVVYSRDPETLPLGSYALDDYGHLIQRDELTGALEPVAGKGAPKIKQLVRVKDAMRSVYRLQADGRDDAAKTAIKLLNQTYDKFVKANGPISLPANLRLVAQDPENSLLLALENYDSLKKTATKTDIFTGSPLVPVEVPETVDTVDDGLLLSLTQRGRIDPEYIAKKTDRDLDDVINEMVERRLGFLDPDELNNGRNVLVDSNNYLSGNVKEKLRIAEESSVSHSVMKHNIEALKAVQPKDLEIDEISTRINSPFTGTKNIEKFLNYLTDGRAKVVHVRSIGKYEVQVYSPDYALVTTKWGTNKKSAIELVTDILNGKSSKVYQYNADKTRTLDPEETARAQEKAEAIKEEFDTWWRTSTKVAKDIQQRYNDEYNSMVNRKWEHPILQADPKAEVFFPGCALPYSARPHSAAAVFRVLQSANTLLAHVVGSGKTNIMIWSAMELRRLGLRKKPMISVPNHMLEQWTNDFLASYPTAKVLIAREDDIKNRRKVFVNKVATGDWDAIIIKHSSLALIPVNPKVESQYLESQIAEYQAAYDAAREAGAKKQTVKQLENRLAAMKEKVKKNLDLKRDKGVLYFDELGVDHLMVDESHMFKNLDYNTQLENVKGMGQPAGSQRARDMLMKVGIIQGSGGGVTFATGTPISNSLVEAYSLMRFLQPEILKSLGIASFDEWSRQFAEPVTRLEMNSSGTAYKPVTRFSKMINVPELMTLLRQAWDIRTGKMLENDNILVPGKNMPTSSFTTVTAPQSPMIRSYLRFLQWRENRLSKEIIESGEDNALVIIGDGKKAAVDLRLIDPTLPDDPESKVNTVVNSAFEIWEKGKKEKNTQAIFYDLTSPDSKVTPFNVVQDMIDKLVDRGVPRKEIATIWEANTDARKKALFDKVNAGEVRIVIGSRKKMGAGTNIQKRLGHIHQIDVPWTPEALEQSNGRGIRQGNTNKHVVVNNYVTQGSLDTGMWALLETKASAIAQIMNDPDAAVRELEEDFYRTATSMSAVGPMKESMATGQKLQELETSRKAFAITKAQATRQVETSESDIAYQESAIAKEQKIIDGRSKKMPVGNDFTMVINDKKFLKSATAAKSLEILSRKMRKLKNNDLQTIGEFAGFPVLYKHTQFSDGNYKHEIFSKPTADRKYMYEAYNSPVSGAGAITTLRNKIYSMPDRNIKRHKANIEQTKRLTAVAKETLKKTWGKDAELEKTKARFAELQVEVAALNEKAQAEMAADPYQWGHTRQKLKVVTEEGSTKVDAGAPPPTDSPDSYYVHVQDGAGGTVFKSVPDAKPVQVPGVPDSYGFFIHKSEVGNFKWTVTEPSTGLAVGHGDTQKAAIESASTLIANAGDGKFDKDKFDSLLDGAIEKNGASPRGQKKAPETKADIAKAEGREAIDRVNEFISEHSEPPLGMSIKLLGDGKRDVDDNLNMPGGGKPTESGNPEVEERWQASRGVKAPGIAKKVMQGLVDLKNNWSRHFAHLDNEKFAREIDILRQFENVSHYSKAHAYSILRGIMAGLGPKKRNIFERNVIIPDLVRDVESGMYDWVADAQKKGEDVSLPFGYKDLQEIKDDAARFKAIADANPDIKESIATRQRFMKDLRKSLVEYGYLDEKVLEDDRYFHHMVLQKMEEQDLYNLGTGSKEFRVGTKGWQYGRVGSVKDYNTKYIESEFEVVSQGLALIEAAKSLEQMKDLADMTPKLRQMAKDRNERLLKAKLLTDMDITPEEAANFDPLQDFRKRIAMAMGRLQAMAENGELDSPNGLYQHVINNMAQGITENSNDFFPFLNQLMENNLPGAPEAGGIFKAVADRNKFIKETLGGQFVDPRNPKSLLKIAPDGYAEWQPRKGWGMYPTQSIAENVLEGVLAGEKELQNEDIKQIMALRWRESWIVPKPLAAQMDALDQWTNDPFQLMRNITNAWKKYILINPARVMKYNINNMSGDFDIAMAYNPKIMKHFWSAAQELFGYNVRGRAPSEELLDLVKRGAIDSGLTINNIEDLNKDMFLKALAGEKPSLINKYWGTAKNYTQWRENILRLSAYRFFMAEGKAGRISYGVSNPTAIDALRAAGDPKAVAAKLSRELIGDYGNLSIAGQWLRDHMMPFYSWMEINTPRYVRLMRNVKHEIIANEIKEIPMTEELREKILQGSGLSREQRRRLSAFLKAKGKRGAMKLAAKYVAFTAFATALYTAATLWNKMFPEEEREGVGLGRRQLHVLIPNPTELAKGNVTAKDQSGAITSLRFQGALSDALSWFALEDFPYDAMDLIAGKKGIGEMVGEAGEAAVSKVTNSITPFMKTPAELMMGRSFYPNALRPRPIRDKFEHAARMVSLPDLPVIGDAYKFAAHKTRREPMTDLRRLIFYVTDPGEAAYHGIRSEAYKWLEQEGYEMGGSDPKAKANALYYYKKAIIYKDKRAEKHWLKEYVKHAGSVKSASRGLQSSVRRAHPLGFMPKKYRGAFMAQLSEKDAKLYQSAIDWYQLVFSNNKQKDDGKK